MNAAELKKAAAKAKRERWELTFLQQLEVSDLPIPMRQFRFHVSRRWTFDFAWDETRATIGLLAVEIDGGVYSQGRHTRGAGYTEDCEKLNAATLLGWRVLRFTSAMVKDGRAIETVKQVFNVQQTNKKRRH